jgi:hypothetical protein
MVFKQVFTDAEGNAQIPGNVDIIGRLTVMGANVGPGLGSGDVTGPGTATADAVALFDGTSGQLIKNSTVTVSVTGSITVPPGETVDGRDISADGSTVDSHTANTSNPHGTTATQVGLGNVTNNAQLTRGSGDWTPFGVKMAPNSSDYILIEDTADSGAKKRAAFPTGGDVFGPIGATDEGIARFDGTTGELLQDSNVTISNAGNITLPGSATVDGRDLSVDGTKLDLITVTQAVDLDQMETDHEVFKQPLSTGFEGAPPVLTVNGNGVSFDMSACAIVHVDSSTNPPTVTRSAVPAQTAVAPAFLATGVVSYISIDSTGAIAQRAMISTPQQRREYASVGAISHRDNINVDGAINAPTHNHDVAAQVHDLISALGFFSTGGNLVSGLATTLTIAKSSGTGFALNINPANPKDPHSTAIAGASPAFLIHLLQDGTIVSASATIDPTVYDLAGVATTVPANKNATISYVYLFSNGSMVYLIGQEVFATFADAKDAAGTETIVLPPDLATGALLLARVILKKNATDITDPSEAFILPSAAIAAGGSSVTSLQEAYDISLEPEILTDSTRGALTLRRGSAADTDTILEGQNAATAVTFSVTGEGVITADSFAGAGIATQVEVDAGTNDTRIVTPLKLRTAAPTAHTIASHSDTTATGAELETLTDGSNADSLHTHAVAGIFGVSGLTDTDYYSSSISNPFAGQTLLTCVALVEMNKNIGDEQVIFSSHDYDSVGGLNSGVSFALFGNGGISPRIRYWDNGGTQRITGASWPSGLPYTRKLCLVALEVDFSTADADYMLYVNGASVANGSTAGAGGALPAGSGSNDLLVGRNTAGETWPAEGLTIYGFGWRFGAFNTPAQHSAWYETVIDALELSDSPAGLNSLYIISGSDPGATWSPTIGSGSLTREGTPVFGSRAVYPM